MQVNFRSLNYRQNERQKYHAAADVQLTSNIFLNSSYRFLCLASLSSSAARFVWSKNWNKAKNSPTKHN